MLYIILYCRWEIDFRIIAIHGTWRFICGREAVFACKIIIYNMTSHQQNKAYWPKTSENSQICPILKIYTYVPVQYTYIVRRLYVHFPIYYIADMMGHASESKTKTLYLLSAMYINTNILYYIIRARDSRERRLFIFSSCNNILFCIII